MTTAATIESLTSVVTAKRTALDKALAVATQWTGQGAVAFARSELAAAERALAAAQPEAAAKAAADAASLAEYEAHRSATILARAAARRGDESTTVTTFRTAPPLARRSRCYCGHCMTCIGE